MSEVLDNAVGSQRYSFLNALLPGRQRSFLGKSAEYPVLGDVPFMRQGSEWTGGDHNTSAPDRQLSTSNINIPSKKVFAGFGISDYLEQYSLMDMRQLVVSNLSKSYLQTIADIVLNSDSSTGATGNINSDDQAAATTFTLDGLLDRRMFSSTSIRYSALTAGTTVNIGTVAGYDDIADVAALLSFDG